MTTVFSYFYPTVAIRLFLLSSIAFYLLLKVNFPNMNKIKLYFSS